MKKYLILIFAIFALNCSAQTITIAKGRSCGVLYEDTGRDQYPVYYAVPCDCVAHSIIGASFASVSDYIPIRLDCDGHYPGKTMVAQSIPVPIINPEQQTGFRQPPDHIFMDFTYLKKPTRKQLKACGSGSVTPIYVNMPDGAKVVFRKVLK